nr:unnamed protein product [Callosobruchus analis]
MTVTSGSVTIKKDANNLIGISIGGGAPYCPCLYIVQIFDNTAAARDGTLQSGDELVSVNGQSVKLKTKVEVAKMIQATKDEVCINYNKLHADPQQGKSLDIVMKKMKHRLVENMSSSTAMHLVYPELFFAHMELQQAVKAMGDVFASLAVREPQPRASEAFRLFGEQHRSMEKLRHDMVKKIKPVLSDMGTYLYKAIPDTRLTVKKYADAKFEYLAYCLKVKEMDDEECYYAAQQEPIYRVETGNYEYRLILRCRQLARARFAKLRADVLDTEDGDVVEAEEVTETNTQNLICDLGAEEDSQSEALLSDIPNQNQIEPNYDDMDNLTLLSSLAYKTPQCNCRNN